MKYTFPFAILTALVLPAHAATIVDPTLASGPGDVIDPTGDGQDADQTFGSSQATLEARSDLRVLQSFSGFEGSGTGNNVVSHTSSTLPDIQFQFSGAYNTTSAGSSTTSDLNNSSSGTALTQRNADTTTGNTSTLTISFGNWDGSSFANNQTVAAAGFVLTQLYGNKSGTVQFFDGAGVAITGATFNYSGESNADGAMSGDHKDIYFGWDSADQSSSEIGSIQITFVDAADEFGSGFDDLAFTVIPEPSAMFLGGLGALLLLRRRRCG